MMLVVSRETFCVLRSFTLTHKKWEQKSLYLFIKCKFTSRCMRVNITNTYLVGMG